MDWAGTLKLWTQNAESQASLITVLLLSRDIRVCLLTLGKTVSDHALVLSVNIDEQTAHRTQPLMLLVNIWTELLWRGMKTGFMGAVLIINCLLINWNPLYRSGALSGSGTKVISKSLHNYEQNLDIVHCCWVKHHFSRFRLRNSGHLVCLPWCTTITILSSVPQQLKSMGLKKGCRNPTP